MEKLRNSPLVYVLTVVEFSSNPNISSMPSEQLAIVTKKMFEAGYPDRIVSTNPLIEFQFVNQGVASPTVRQPQRLIFRAAGEMSAIYLSENSLSLITTQYNTFEEFNTEFQKALRILTETVPDQNKTVLKRIGLRYINLITPTSGKRLSDYFVENVLPVKLDMFGEPKDKYGITTSVMKLNDFDNVVLKIEEINAPEKKVHKVIPEDLMEPDVNAGLRIIGHDNWHSISNNTYGILDIDQQHFFDASPLFTTTLLQENIQQLHDYNEKVFNNIVSEDALIEWK